MNKSLALRSLIATATILLLGHYFWLLASKSNDTQSAKAAKVIAERYYCPMHPSITSDHADKCPICGMTLQKQETVGTTLAKNEQRKIVYYRHPMGKDVKSKTPMKDEMGMDFIPVYEDELDSDSSAPVEGRSSFLLSDLGQQLIGVKKTTVSKTNVNYEIKASGRVAFDPELNAAITEYQVAAQTAKQTSAALESVKKNSTNLIQSAELKLKLMGLSEDQLKLIRQGQFDKTGLVLPDGKLAWVYADIYEYELPYLKVGQEISADSPIFPALKFSGKVLSISPNINAITRTVGIRAEVSDPEKVLRPDMFLTVRIKANLGEQLVVPEDAVIHTGDISLVFKVNDSGRFEPTKVEASTKSEGKTIIVSGLSEGDTVVSGANFLIDSESRLRAVVQSAISTPTTKKD